MEILLTNISACATDGAQSIVVVGMLLTWKKTVSIMFTIYRHSLSTSGFKPLNDCLNKSVYTAVNKQAVNDRLFQKFYVENDNFERLPLHTDIR